jgi:hypothetical protein
MSAIIPARSAKRLPPVLAHDFQGRVAVENVNQLVAGEMGFPMTFPRELGGEKCAVAVGRQSRVAIEVGNIDEALDWYGQIFDFKFCGKGECNAEPPTGRGSCAAGSCAELCATRAYRSLDTDGGCNFSVIGVRTWRLADLGPKHALLLAGMGWGNMPEPMVDDDLAAGRLRRLDLPEWLGGFYPFHTIHRTDTPSAPAAAWLIRHFSWQTA